MIQRWLELHDSVLDDLEPVGGVLEVRLSGYVHQWESTPAGRVGTGWVMPVVLRIEDGLHPGHVDTPDDVWDGMLSIGARSFSNVIPLPFNALGDINLVIGMRSGRPLEVRGAAIEVVGSLEQRVFVEDLREDLVSDVGSG